MAGSPPGALLPSVVLGWREDEVVGHPATILRPDDPAWISRGFAEVMAGETLVAVPVRYPHRDGRPRDLELFVAPLRDEDGGVRGAVVVAEDVTAIHEAQSDRARLATAIDQAAEAIVVTDPDGRIVYANPAFERITGYARAELLGQNPRVLKSGAHDAAFYDGMWATLTAGRDLAGPPRQPAQGRLALRGGGRDLAGARRRRADHRLRRREARPDRRTSPRGRPASRAGRSRRRPRGHPGSRLARRRRRRRSRSSRPSDPSTESSIPSVFHLPAHDGQVFRMAGRMPARAVVPGEVVDELAPATCASERPPGHGSTSSRTSGRRAPTPPPSFARPPSRAVSTPPSSSMAASVRSSGA